MIDEHYLMAMVESSDVILEAPTKRKFYEPHYIITLAIGNDHTADLTIDEESLQELCERNDHDFETILGERLK